jgi:transposase-like protein
MYQLKQIPSEAKIKTYLRHILFGKNLFCPECASREVVVYEDRYRCKRCRHKFSLLSHTWLKDMKIPLQKFWLILWCWTTAIPVKQAQALVHLSEEAVRHWYGLFRAQLPENNEILEKIVQMDEAYFKQRTLLLAKQPGTRKLAYEIVNAASVQRHHATYFLHQHIKPKTKFHTDGASIYKSIEHWWPVIHDTDIHKKFEFGITSEIEGAFGNLRTFIRRMYHHVTAEHLPEIVREFCFRFSSPQMFENPLNYLRKTLIHCTN